VVLVKGKLPVQDLEGCPTMAHELCSVGLKLWSAWITVV